MTRIEKILDYTKIRTLDLRLSNITGNIFNYICELLPKMNHINDINLENLKSIGDEHIIVMNFYIFFNIIYNKKINYFFLYRNYVTSKFKFFN
jgi:hypothetical protein